MTTMKAMQLDQPGTPLHMVERELPEPGEGELRIAIAACGVCRTDLHVTDGDIHGTLPIVPGHEVVGHVDAIGPGVGGFKPGDRVGVPWLGHSCGHCPYCRNGQENLCDSPLFTGFTRDGGFASHCIADAHFCFPIPDGFDDIHAAPLLCAGLIGYRSYRMAGDAPVLGLYGFGAAAHILAQLAIWQGRTVYAFTREGDEDAQAFARELGCAWAGSSTQAPPQQMDAAIIFAPVGPLVPQALKMVKKGGRVVCAGIHMSDIPAFPYADLWEERQILSVANLTRADGTEFLDLAARAGISTHVTAMKLAEANQALDRLRAGEVEGAIVLLPDG
ncbi:propanol-preferring alcohol dehydrogenase [Altererythrobacter atlanticus]|uniref:alcohol dehydrogenase n=1 Tax=Croceibacterium atlanticum TaxID=1267766 RepID=A0A0F7KWX1_9SPHN|nr:zinc-dependent alcohol dehydrogenase family protein [Croceibacterium atlanticum]AKH43691.1 Alcohol dehydrogenase [Croceibacterium atlanticum]MBB5733825.1 propanol-preferring alcohol dehydrogenase [Croceibacterium atlanticum]